MPQYFLNINVPLVPPNPNELLIANFTLLCCALFGVKFKSNSVSGLSRLIVGGIIPYSSDLRLNIASTAPAAPNKCPIADFVDDTYGANRATKELGGEEKAIEELEKL